MKSGLQQKLADNKFFLKTKYKHSRIGSLLYFIHLIWWITAIHPVTANLRSFNTALGFFVLILNFITGYQAYYQYRHPSSRRFTEFTTVNIGWQILLAIIVEQFYFDYGFNKSIFFSSLFVFAILLLFCDLFLFINFSKIILFRSKLGGIVATSMSTLEKYFTIVFLGTLWFSGTYYILNIYFTSQDFWLRYPDQLYVMSFALHIFINYSLLNALIISLVQRNYLEKRKYDLISFLKLLISTLIYTVMAHGKDFSILF